MLIQAVGSSVGIRPLEITVSEEWITTEQAAEIAKVDPATIRYAARKGKLIAKKFGPVWVVSKVDLMRWIEDEDAHKTGPKKP